MRFSFNTFNHSTWLGLAPSLPAQIAAAAAAGYDHVGLDVPSVLAHADAGLGPDVLAGQMAEAGITPYELSFLSLSNDAESTRRSLEQVLGIVAAVHPEQVQTTILGPADEQCIALAREAVNALGGVGVGLALEYLPNVEVRSIAQSLEVIERVGVPGFRVCVDTYHFFHGPDTWADLDALPLEQLAFVQFDDALALVDGDLNDGMLQRRALPGEGRLALDDFCERIVGRGYDGVVSVEVLSAEWRARPVEDFVRASLTTTRAFWERAHGQVDRLRQ